MHGVVFPAHRFARGGMDELEGRVVVGHRRYDCLPGQVRQLIVEIFASGVGEEEPLGIQMLQEAVVPHGLNRGVDRFDQIGAGREDEAELFRGQRIAHHLQRLGIGPDVAPSRRRIHQHEIHIAVDQRLHRRAEVVEELDARVGFVAVQDVVDCRVEARRTRLRTDQQFLVGGKGLRIVKALLVRTHQHELLRVDVRRREVDLLGPLLGDGDAVHAHVELTLGHRRNHRLPRAVLEIDRAVQTPADLVHGVVFPAHRFPRARINELEGRVVVRHRRYDCLPGQVRQVIDYLGRAGCGGRGCGSARFRGGRHRRGTGGQQNEQRDQR